MPQQSCVAATDVVVDVVAVVQCVSGIWKSLMWLQWFGFRLELISCDDQATPKIVTHLKNGQK